MSPCIQTPALGKLGVVVVCMLIMSAFARWRQEAPKFGCLWLQSEFKTIHPRLHESLHIKKYIINNTNKTLHSAVPP